MKLSSLERRSKECWGSRVSRVPIQFMCPAPQKVMYLGKGRHWIFFFSFFCVCVLISMVGWRGSFTVWFALMWENSDQPDPLDDILIKCGDTGCFCSINCDSIVWTGPTACWQTIALSPIRSNVDFWIWSYLSWEDSGFWGITAHISSKQLSLMVRSTAWLDHYHSCKLGRNC